MAEFRYTQGIFIPKLRKMERWLTTMCLSLFTYFSNIQIRNFLEQSILLSFLMFWHASKAQYREGVMKETSFIDLNLEELDVWWERASFSTFIDDTEAYEMCRSRFQKFYGFKSYRKNATDVNIYDIHINSSRFTTQS